ncbi:ESCRT-0 complex protein [Malassezia pachydermatis]
MFRAPNPFEELVLKATDENLTAENWELNLALCDKLASNHDGDARYCISAIQKRVVHRNANVQLYALTLTDTLSKNCGDAIHHEIASRAFMQTLTKLVHYDLDEEPASAANHTDLQRQEEDELQRVLALSLEDQGRRTAHTPMVTPGPSASGSSNAAPPPPPTAVQAATPVMPPTASSSLHESAPAGSGSRMAVPAPSIDPTSVPAPTHMARPAFVRAVYDFEPDEPGELALKKGDIVRVLDSVYEQWWRGEKRHEVGIFPVNYVEPMPDDTPDLIQQEMELERTVFAHASDIHRLHARLQRIQPHDNFVDDDELQELYQRSLALRPKIIKLMDKYHTKVQELRALNDKFVSARSTLDDMIQQHVQYTSRSVSDGPSDSAASSTSLPTGPSVPSMMPMATSTPPIVVQPPSTDPTPASTYEANSETAPEAMPIPHDDEKRLLYERARAEVEEYHRQNQAGSSSEPSTSELHGLTWQS